jgi:hypothetical protein
MKIERLIRNTIFTWQAWFLRKKLHRKSQTLADLDRKEAAARALHRPTREIAAERRQVILGLLGGKVVRH